MKALKWMSWPGMFLLAAGLMWTMGCGGSDGDGGGTTTTVVVTNATGETTTVVVTNTPAEPEEQALVAPQIVSPTEGQVFGTLIALFPVDVEIQWTPVPGADSYVLYVDSATYEVTGSSHTVSLAIGNHKCRINAVRDGLKGPLSSWRNFEVELQPLVVNP